MLKLIVVFLYSQISRASGEIVSGDIAWTDADEVGDLIQNYYTIFPNGNRNAASHRWATYILERSTSLDKSTFELMFSGFCPVSGSPISRPGAHNLWEMDLHMAGTEDVITGGVYFCCWPCVCDTSDFIQVDTKTVEVADGTFEFNFLVLGDPCTIEGGSAKIPMQAPDATCDGEELVKATYSDNGYVIIGLLQDLGQLQRYDENVVSEHCADRAEQGYLSGMGTIFREVAEINPIEPEIETGVGEDPEIIVNEPSTCDNIRNPEAIIIDVRTQVEWNDGHVICAVNIDYNGGAFTENAVRSVTNDNLNALVVLYCRSGARAANAKSLMESWGFTSVINNGGYVDVQDCACPSSETEDVTEAPETSETETETSEKSEPSETQSPSAAQSDCEIKFEMVLGMTSVEFDGNIDTVRTAVAAMCDVEAFMVGLKIVHSDRRRAHGSLHVEVAISTNLDNKDHVVETIQGETFAEDLQYELSVEGVFAEVTDISVPVVFDYTNGEDKEVLEIEGDENMDDNENVEINDSSSAHIISYIIATLFTMYVMF